MASPPSRSSALVAALSVWVPRAVTEGPDARRGALFVYSCALAAVVVCTTWITLWAQGTPSPWVHFGLAVVLGMLALAIRVLHITESVPAAVNVLLAIGYGLTLGLLLLSGGHTNPATSVLLVEALVAFYFLDRAWRVFWVGCVAAGFVVLAIGAGFDLPAAAVFSVPTHPVTWLTLQLWLLAQLTAMIVLLDRGTDAVRTDARRAVELAEERAEAALQRADRARHVAREARARAAEAEARAGTLTEAHRTFLSNLAHEIRTPLSSTQGALDVLLGTPLDPDQRRLIETALSASEGLGALLADVLAHQGLHEDGVATDRMGFRIRKLMAELEASREGLARGLGLAWTIRLAPDVPELVEGDPARLRQVLFNLVDNAFKYTSEGGVEVEVEVVGRDLRFSVRDTGLGIPGYALPTLFDTLERPRLEGIAAGGSGLGLAISKRIVEALGGTIGVESEPDRGSTFWFQLPLVEATWCVDDLRTMSSWARELPHGLRVLLVEDNPINRMVASRLLEQHGCAIRVATDGQEAVAMWREEPPDLILMDVRMPRMDGLQATRAIRALEDGAVRVPIIAVTADVQEDRREDCVEAGMDDVITKPFRADDLRRILLRAVRDARRQLRAIA